MSKQTINTASTAYIKIIPLLGNINLIKIWYYPEKEALK